jgi:hypothetical protein
MRAPGLGLPGRRGQADPRRPARRAAATWRAAPALTAVSDDDQRRLGVITDWKHGPHQLTCRQAEYTLGLVARITLARVGRWRKTLRRGRRAGPAGALPLVPRGGWRRDLAERRPPHCPAEEAARARLPDGRPRGGLPPLCY